MQGLQINNSPIEKSSKAKMFSMPTLIEEMKPVVLFRFELEYRISRKIKIKLFSWDISDYQDTDAKKNDFFFQSLFTSAVFWIEILMEETKLVVAEH